MATAQYQGVVGIVDDDGGIRQSMSWLLTAARYDVVAFASAEEFLQRHPATSCDCLILDLCLPGIDGVGLHDILQHSDRETPVLFMTGDDSDRARARLRNAGITQWLCKPFDAPTLIGAVRRILERRM
jgi:FixJ family two-component response regulator